MIPLIVAATSFTPCPNAPYLDEVQPLVKALHFTYLNDVLTSYHYLGMAWDIMDTKYINAPFDKRVFPLLVFMFCAHEAEDWDAYESAIHTLREMMENEFEK